MKAFASGFYPPWSGVAFYFKTGYSFSGKGMRQADGKIHFTFPGAGGDPDGAGPGIRDQGRARRAGS
jgi:hypothetical protein